MSTYAETKPTTRKEVTPRKATQSEWPYRVQSYQFKSLDDARNFSQELAAIPKTGHRHSVGMYHRRLEMTIHNDGEQIICPILLDVTTDSPDEAETKYVGPQ